MADGTREAARTFWKEVRHLAFSFPACRVVKERYCGCYLPPYWAARMGYAVL